MDCAPFRHVGEEANLEEIYPEWFDQSRVSYSWDGLLFPRAAKPAIVPFETELWGSP
jgi:hypothetical protein